MFAEVHVVITQSPHVTYCIVHSLATICLHCATAVAEMIDGGLSIQGGDRIS